MKTDRVEEWVVSFLIGSVYNSVRANWVKTHAPQLVEQDKELLARAYRDEEMRARPTIDEHPDKAILYNGVSKEGEGRCECVCEREKCRILVDCAFVLPTCVCECMSECVLVRACVRVSV